MSDEPAAVVPTRAENDAADVALAEWQALGPKEATIEPDLEIVDPHHHLWIDAVSPSVHSRSSLRILCTRRPLTLSPLVIGHHSVYQADLLLCDVHCGAAARWSAALPYR